MAEAGGGMKAQDFWNGAVGLFYIACFFALLAFIAYLLYGPGIQIPLPFDPLATSTPKSATPATGVSLEGVEGVSYACADGKYFKAAFTDGSVRLSLSDGRVITLPQTASGPGDTFANTDSSFLFWKNVNAAYVREMGAETYKDCTTS